MRRLDLRPRKKLRNPGRHLRQLARWPQRIVDAIPTPQMLEGERFWNFKVPIFSKLVEGLYATPDAQRACIAAIFAAAEAIERSSRRPANARIACLITTPSLFDSEVTIFTDEEYFNSFLPRPETRRSHYDGGWVEGSPADPAVISAILPPAPEGLAFMDGTRLLQHDDLWERGQVEQFNWVWAYPRR